ncbi:MAG TPA: hypothetical protein HPP66_03775 [Planctomycetes bacterium]|nr:hypothetical protein [Planctomycetota bacterium]
MDNEKESPKVFEKLLFPKIFQSFRIAIHYKNLIIAFLAVTVVCLSGWIMDFSKTVVAITGPEGRIIETELQIYMTNPGQLESYIENAREDSERTGVFSTLWRFAAGRFHNALNCLFAFNIPGVFVNIAEYFKAVTWVVRYHLVYCVIFAVIKLVVMAIADGAICRIAALQFARNEKPGLLEALRFSTNKFTSFVTAPLAPVGIIIFIGFFIFLLGLVGNIPWAGELIMGIFMVLALIAGALIAVVSIGAVAGFNLMFPAVAYDGSDCFDAISRAFSYVYAKPWRMIFYTAIAAVYGAICYIFVRFFTFLMLWVTHRSLQLGVLGGNKKLTAIWPGPSLTNIVDAPDLAAANWSQTVAAVIVYLLLLAVAVLVASFILSFYFSANTIIYSLMRNNVDNTALDDIYTPSVEIETEPTAIDSKKEEAEPESE